MPKQEPRIIFLMEEGEPTEEEKGNFAAEFVLQLLKIKAECKNDKNLE